MFVIRNIVLTLRKSMRQFLKAWAKLLNDNPVLVFLFEIKENRKTKNNSIIGYNEFWEIQKSLEKKDVSV